MEQSVDINKYILKFSIAYAIGLVAVTAIFYIFDLNGSSGVSIVLLISAAMYAVGEFIKEHKRTPNKSEKYKLAWLSLIISWVMSILLAVTITVALSGIQGLFELSDLALELNTIIIFVIIFIVSLLNFAILLWSYGGLANKKYKTLHKKGLI
jgi:hypothetical protein